MIGVLIGLQEDGCNVSQVRPARFLVDWTLVHASVLFVGCGVDGVNVNDRHGLKQDFGFGLDEFAAPLVPPSSLKEESVHVHALRGWGSDVVFHLAGDVVV